MSATLQTAPFYLFGYPVKWTYTLLPSRIKTIQYERITHSSYQTVFVRITRCSMRKVDSGKQKSTFFSANTRFWNTKRDTDSEQMINLISYHGTYLLDVETMDRHQKQQSKVPRIILNDLRMSPHVGFWTLIHPLQPRKLAQFQCPDYESFKCGSITRGVCLI